MEEAGNPGRSSICVIILRCFLRISFFISYFGFLFFGQVCFGMNTFLTLWIHAMSCVNGGFTGLVCVVINSYCDLLVRRIADLV
jgi:hypothetical protein